MFMKKFSLLLLGLGVSFLSAEQSVDEKIAQIEKTLSEITFTTKEGITAPKTAAAGPITQGMGGFLYVDVLCWQTKADGLAYTAVDKSFRNGPPVISDDTVLEPHFHWNCRVKAGAGYHFDYDGWDLLAEYTYFKNKGKGEKKTDLPQGLNFIDSETNSVTAQSFYNYSEGINYAGYAANARSDVKVTLNDAHLELGRNFYLSKRLSARANFGVQASWISLHQRTGFTGGFIAYTVPTEDTGDNIISLKGLDYIEPGSKLSYKKHSKTAAVGPRAGVNTSWSLTHGFSIYGDFAQSLLFGYIKRQRAATYSAFPDNLLDQRYNYHRLIPVTMFELGLSYDSFFYEDKHHILVRLGYENVYYFNAVGVQIGRIPTSIGFYGVNLKLRWDF